MMKLEIFFLTCLLLAITSCKDKEQKQAVIVCLPQSLSGNILAFYPFSKGALNDFSGNNHSLVNTTTAKPASDRNGNDSCAYEFDNLPVSGEFLTTSATSFLNNLNEFSVSLWYQAKDTSRSGGGFESLINRDLAMRCPDRNGQWSVALYDCRKAVFGRTNSVWDKHITSNSECAPEFIIRTGNWNHLVATFKKNGPEMAIYRNGVLQQASTGHGNCGPGIPDCLDIGDLFLGKDYTGKLDDVVILNKALSQQEVNVLFNLGTCCEKY